MKLEAYTLPDRETLERLGGYEDDEVKIISEAAEAFNRMTLPERKQLGPEFLHTLWPDPFTFAEKTHVILDNRVGSESFGQLIRLVPNYAQRKLIEIMRKQQKDGVPIRIVICKARQLGMSTFLQSWMFNRCDYIPNHRSMTISYDEDSTKEMFQKQITIKRNLWCPQETIRDSSNLIEFKNGSVFLTATAGKFNAGRSFTLHALHMSETPMWPNSSEVLTAVLQTVAKHPDTAVFMESTAKGAQGSFYEYWNAAEEGRSSFHPFFAPWFWDPEYTYHFKSDDDRNQWRKRFLKPEDAKYMRKYDLSIDQMAWRYYKIQDDLEGNPLRFRQEYPAEAREAFLSSGSPRYNADLVDALAHQVEKPIYVGDIGPRRGEGDEIEAELHENPHGPFKVWALPQAKREYVVGVDTAEGKVRDRPSFAKAQLLYRDQKPDYSAAIVIDLETGRHVASWHGDIETIEWPYVATAIAIYFNRALIIPEVNGPGNEVVNTIAKRLRYQNLYRNRRQIVADGDDFTPKWGWFTDKWNRDRMLARGAEIIVQDEHCTRDHDLIREIRTVEICEDGVARARHPNKDDRVIAWCLALQARLEYHMGELGDGQPKDDPYAGLPKEDRAIWKAYDRRHARMDDDGPSSPLPAPGGYPLPGQYFGR